MSSSINFKKKNLNLDFMKRTTGLIGGSVKHYISNALPTTSSALNDAKSTMNEIHSKLSNTTQEVIPKIKKLKMQNSIKNIYQWYMEKEDEYSDDSSGVDNIDFDIDTEPSDIADIQIGEGEKNSNKIAKSVVDSSKQLVESQLAATANLQITIDKQTKVIDSGFKLVTESLNNILEVVTKNTSAIIETNSSGNPKKDNEILNMLRFGKFNSSAYKKIVSSNIKNSFEYTYLSSLPMLFSQMKDIGPQELFAMAFDFGMSKIAPNLKNNMLTVDNAINNSIMESLIKLGTHDSNRGLISGYLSKFLGINSSREDLSTSRSKLEVKSVAFDSITRESITNTIPGYLRKILVALGGEDIIYDYRSRSFKSKSAIRDDFYNNSINSSSINQASSVVRNTLGKSNASDMFYEMFITELGNRDDNLSDLLKSFKDKDALSTHMRQKVLKDMELNNDEVKALESFINGLSSLTGNNNGIIDIMMQSRKNNVMRNSRLEEYINTADLYNIDLSEFTDSLDNDLDAIARKFGKSIYSKSSNNSIVKPINVKQLSGVDYTNVALYQIFRRLDTGINVFQVGHGRYLKDRYDKFGDDYLPAPLGYKSRSINNNSNVISLISDIQENNSNTNSQSSEDYGPNYLQDQLDENGQPENLTASEKFLKWAKYRGGNLRHAMFFGTPEQTRLAFGSIINDISQVAGDGIKKGVSKIDDSFGNISGYLKHKLFGTEYEYNDGEDENGNPIKKKVAANEKGGIFGFIKDYTKEMFAGTGDKAKNWFKQVSGYFDYGDSDNPDEQGIAAKRRKLIATSVGAFAGAGIMGLPIGLIMGGLAGNVLGSLDIKGKIKNLLFGYDNENKPTGLLSKFADSFIDPIKYQFGKSAALIGKVLQKNILGPLSDIGQAIKDRMTTTFDNTIGKGLRAIGGVFKKIALAPLALIKMLFGAVTSAKGALFRGKLSAKGALAGGLLGGIAGVIGKGAKHTYTDENGEKQTVSANKWRKMRKEKRDKEIDEAYANSKYNKKYKDYRQEQRERRAKWVNKFDEYTSGEISQIQANATEQVADNTSAIADTNTTISENLAVLTYDATHHSKNNSIQTHDQNLHDRVDAIIEILSGGKKYDPDSKKIVDNKSNDDAILDIKSDDNKSNDHEIASSAITAAIAGASSSGDEITADENRTTDNIIDEATKTNPNKATISQKLKELISIQKKNPEENDEEKPTFLSRITDSIKNGFSSVFGNTDIKGAIIGALVGVLGFKDLKSFYNNVIKGDMNFAEWWGEESIIGQGWKGIKAISSALTPLGAKIVNPITKFVNKTIHMVPGLSDIPDIPSVDANGPLAGLQVAILSSVYLKGASAIGSAAAAIAGLINAGSNMVGGSGFNLSNLFVKSSGKYNVATTALSKIAPLALPAALGYSIANGGIDYENTNAAGEEITNQSMTRATNLKAKEVVHRIFGHNSMIDPGYKLFSKVKATNRAVDAAQLAYKYGDDAVEAARKALTRQATQLGLDPKKIMSDKKLKKTVEKAVESAKKSVKTTSSATDNSGVLRKAVSKLKAVLDDFFEYIKNSKVFKKVAGAGKYIDDLLEKLYKYINVDAFKPLTDKVVKIVAKVTGKDVAGAVTAGIGYGVFGILGGISGKATAANIFMVKESDVDDTMEDIATVIVAALNGVPCIGYIELVDLVLVPATGISFRQLVCQSLYELLDPGKGSDHLDMLQQEMFKSVDSYNNKYNTNLSHSEYNDMVNSSIFGQMWHGKTKMKDGEYVIDDAGSPVQNKGFKGLFVGDYYEYAKDENGNVLRDNKGKAVKLIDSKGHKVKKDKKWGDYVGDAAIDFGEWVTGDVKYELDENGNVVYKNGKPVVKSVGDDVLTRAGKGILNLVGIDVETTTTSTRNSVADELLKQKIKEKGSDYISNRLKAALPSKNNKLDSNSTLISSEEFFRISSKDINDTLKINNLINKNVKPTLKSLGSALLYPINAFNSSIIDYNKQEYELDENGKPIKDIDGNPVKRGDFGSLMKTSRDKLISFFINPIEEMIKGAEDWEKTQSPWKTSGSKTSSNWVKKSASKLSTKLSSILYNIISSNNAGGGVGGPAEDVMGATNNVINSTLAVEGGNPLNKKFAVSSPYGKRTYPYTGMHKGVDLIPAENTNTPTYVGSRFNGTITAVKSNVPDSDTAVKTSKGWNYTGSNSTGNMVTITTDDGLVIKNMHLKANSIPSNIKVGSRVKIGDKIGEMGSTGWSTGKHLHYQIEKGGNPINPTNYLKGGSNITNFTSSSSTNHMIEDSSINTNADGTSNSPFSKIISAITSFGNDFLNAITGGLLSFNTNINNTNDNSSYGDTSNVITDNADTEELFTYLKSKGYNDAAIAGILGCWTAESANNAFRIEGDYLKSNINKNDLINNRTSMNEFTKNVLWAAYDKQGLSINKNAYYGTDNNLYPGIGYAQWTGPRGQELISYAKNKGISWSSPSLQLDYMDRELHNPNSLYGSNHRDVFNEIQKAKTAEDAVKIWAKKYEGSAADSKRINAAISIYNKYKGSTLTGSNTDFVGGPIDDDSKITKSNYINKDNKPVTKSSYKTSLYSLNSNNNHNDIITRNNVNNVDNDTMVKLLNEVILELRYIRSNTGYSSDLLGELNQKDFVDQGLRNSINALGSRKSKSSITSTSTRSNSRAITSMARP